MTDKERSLQATALLLDMQCAKEALCVAAAGPRNKQTYNAMQALNECCNKADDNSHVAFATIGQLLADHLAELPMEEEFDREAWERFEVYRDLLQLRASSMDKLLGKAQPEEQTTSNGHVEQQHEPVAHRPQDTAAHRPHEPVAAHRPHQAAAGHRPYEPNTPRKRPFEGPGRHAMRNGNKRGRPNAQRNRPPLRECMYGCGVAPATDWQQRRHERVCQQRVRNERCPAPRGPSCRNKMFTSARYLKSHYTQVHHRHEDKTGGVHLNKDEAFREWLGHHRSVPCPDSDDQMSTDDET